MGKIYWLNKEDIVESATVEIPDIEFKIFRTISLEDYLKLKVLIELARTEIAEDFTTFSEITFTQDSASKDSMCFTVCLAVYQNDIIGYGIAYIPTDKITDQLLNEYYLDIVFVNKLYRGKGVSRQIIRCLIEGVRYVNSVNIIKANTQDTNKEAQHLLESYGFEPKRPN